MRVALSTVLVLVLVGNVFAQQNSATEPQRPVDVEQLPVSVDRIEDNLRTPPAISLESTLPLFRVEIVAPRQRWLTDIDWLGTSERVGRIPPFPTIHEQYIARVTPPEARMYSAFEGAELFQVMVTSLIQGLASRKVAAAVKDAVRKRHEEEARREVDEAITRWREQLERKRQPAQSTDSPTSGTEHENTKTENTKF
jgi:hypothetical protein